LSIFSKKPSKKVSMAQALAAFGSCILKLDEEVRNRVSGVVLAAIRHYIEAQDFPDAEEDAFLLFQLASGTVGVEPGPPSLSHGQAKRVRELIEEVLPFNIPLVVMGPIRMVIEEYVTGKDMKEIEYERFDQSDARQVINALMDAIKRVNEACVQEPKKHTVDEVMYIASLAEVVSEYVKDQLPQ